MLPYEYAVLIERRNKERALRPLRPLVALKLPKGFGKAIKVVPIYNLYCSGGM